MSSPLPPAEPIAVEDLAQDTIHTSGTITDAAMEERVKQGDPNWQRRSPMEKQMARFMERQQLQQREAELKREKALEEWRQKDNPDRVTLEEIREAGERSGNALGRARIVLALRGAMQRAGYRLGLV